MADFRKWLFAFAVVALMLGLQVSANAQGFGTAPAFACVANAGVPPIVRAEGVTELVGDLVLNCTGGNPTAVGVPIPLSNIQIFLNTNVTSRILSTSTNLSEATLLIDEPFPTGTASPSTATPVAGAPGTQLACQALNSTNCAILGVGPNGVSGAVGSTSPGPIGNNGPYSGNPGHYNIFQGFQNGVNSVAWLGVPIDAPGTNGQNQLNTRVIRITNVRANACLLGVSSTLIPTQIVMYIAVNGSQQVTINNPQQTVAFIQPGLVTSNNTRTQTQCNNLNSLFLSSSGSLTTSVTPNLITATEGFASSFKVRNYAQIVNGGLTATTVSATNVLQNVPGFSYNTESGFYTAASGIVGTPGLADTGTQLTFTFAAVGAGVNLYVPSIIGLYPSGTASTATLATPPSPNTQSGVAVLVGGTSGTSNGLSTVVITGGVASVTYEVVYSNPNVLEQVIVPVTTAFLSNTAQNLPGVGVTTVSVNFAPLSTVPTATTGPIPRFCQPYPTRTLETINVCSCNLLFPFVTNQAGFDTGVAIANTSLDPYGTSTQAGIVTLYYYGGTTGGGAAPAAQKSTSVAAGSELIFTLSNGGGFGVAATPGFQGYMIAVANFQYCHGFAFISDLGAQRLAEGYLAIQLDIPGLNRTLVVGENEGH